MLFATSECPPILAQDNGWLDSYTVVAPILKEYGFTATLFPITDGLEAASQGVASTVRTLTEGVVSKPFMTWAQARELQDSYGWEMGGHTATHCKIADHHAEHGDAGVHCSLLRVLPVRCSISMYVCCSIAHGCCVHRGCTAQVCSRRPR